MRNMIAIFLFLSLCAINGPAIGSPVPEGYIGLRLKMRVSSSDLALHKFEVQQFKPGEEFNFPAIKDDYAACLFQLSTSEIISATATADTHDRKSMSVTAQATIGFKVASDLESANSLVALIVYNYDSKHDEPCKLDITSVSKQLKATEQLSQSIRVAINLLNADQIGAHEIFAATVQDVWKKSELVPRVMDSLTCSNVMLLKRQEFSDFGTGVAPSDSTADKAAIAELHKCDYTKELDVLHEDLLFISKVLSGMIVLLFLLCLLAILFARYKK